MNNSIHALSCKGMCSEVRVIFLVVSSGDIFVSGTKHGFLFAGELVQSKGSAGSARTRTYWTGCAFLGLQDMTGLTSQRNLSCSRKVTLTAVALCLALSSANQVGRTSNSATCEKSGWHKDHTEHGWHLPSEDLPSCLCSGSPVCLHPHLLGYPETVSVVQEERPLSSYLASLVMMLQEAKSQQKHVLQAAGKGCGVPQVVERPATASRNERELQDGQRQPRRRDDLDCTSISPYPSPFKDLDQVLSTLSELFR